MTTRWRTLLEERTEEAVRAICAIDGVADVVVGGSVGRGEPWPLSDIDLVPITEPPIDSVLPAIAVVRDELVGWWAASGRAQALDVGRLAFTADEVARAMEEGADGRAARMADGRWMHGTDKSFGGRGAVRGGPGQAFADFATETEWVAAVRSARQKVWLDRAAAALSEARDALVKGDAAAAARHASGIGPLSLALLAAWGERDASMGRAITRFERIARANANWPLAERLAEVTGSGVDEVAARAHDLPAWLELRVELAYEARQAVGEDVSWSENLRDQVLAFGWLAPRRTSVDVGDWATRSPVADPDDLLKKAIAVDQDARRLITRNA